MIQLMTDRELFDWLNAWADVDKHRADEQEGSWREGYMQAVRDVWGRLYGPDEASS